MFINILFLWLPLKKYQKLWQWHVCRPTWQLKARVGQQLSLLEEQASSSSFLEAQAVTSISVSPLCPFTTSGHFSVARVTWNLTAFMEQQDRKSNSHKMTEPEGLHPQTATPLVLLEDK